MSHSMVQNSSLRDRVGALETAHAAVSWPRVRPARQRRYRSTCTASRCDPAPRPLSRRLPGTDVRRYRRRYRSPAPRSVRLRCRSRCGVPLPSRRRTRHGRSLHLRPSEPPSEIGLPVTTPVAVWPWFIEYVSIIHAMICSFVFTSGAGMSCIRSDDDADFARVAARQALQFATRQRARIDTDTALRAAVRHVHSRVLHRHPRRQRHHFRQRHVLVITHAAFTRTARHVVLHAIAFEVRDRAVIEFDRAIDDQNALRALQGFDPAGQRAEIRRDAVDLLQVVAPRAEVVWNRGRKEWTC